MNFYWDMFAKVQANTVHRRKKTEHEFKNSQEIQEFTQIPEITKIPTAKRNTL